MAIYRIKNQLKLEKIKERSFPDEDYLQRLVEKNLQELFGLEFISGATNKELTVKGQHQNFYIDTFAFDPQTNSFVIIEYKKDRSFSIIDQGYAYLSAMFNNKADFILEYFERTGKTLKKDDVDWSQSRVIFVAREFTPYQKGSIGFKDLPIELWEAQLSEGDLVAFNQIKPLETQESITTVTKGEKVKKISKELKTYSLEDHRRKGNDKIKTLFDDIREEILAIDEGIKEKPVQNYIGYKMNWFNFTSLHVYQKKIRVTVRKTKLDNDSEKRFKKYPASYAWGETPLWWIDISGVDEIKYVMKVIRESYEAAPDK